MTKSNSESEQSGSGKSSFAKKIIATLGQTVNGGIVVYIRAMFPFLAAVSKNFSDESQWMETLANEAWHVEPKKIKELWEKARKGKWPIWVAQGTTAKLDFADTPYGGAIDFEVTSGAGFVTFWDGDTQLASYEFSMDPGKTFYIRLNTDEDKFNQTWRVEIEGKGEGTAVEGGYPCVNQFALSIVDLKWDNRV